MGWEDAPIVQAAAPRQPWEDAPIVRPAGPRTANGFLDALNAGFQGSATGLALRGRLPDVVLDHTNAKWYEKILAAGAQMVSEIPEMIVGAAAGGAAGTAAGGAVGTAVPVVGNAAGAVVGGIVGTGAGAFAVPAAIRESLIQAYKANEVGSSGDFLSRATIVLKTTAKEGAIGALTFGAGAAAKAGTAALMGAGGAAGAIGTGAATMTTRGAQAVVGTAGAAAEISTMVVTPAALEGRLPEPEDFLNAAILLAGAKGAAAAVGKLQTIYSRAGVRPEEVVAQAKADPTIAADLGPSVTVYHGSQHIFEKFDASKIGTGEGAQAYGHGLYFADRPGTADSYRTLPGAKPQVIASDGRVFAYDSPVAQAVLGMPYSGKTVGEIRVELSRLAEEFKHASTGPVFEKHRAALAGLPADLRLNDGALYKVEIPQRVIDSMLDWDAPMSAQPESVKAALRSAGINPDGALLSKGSELVKGQLWNQIVKNAGFENSDKGRSEFLKSIGIPGVRYLDGGSRAEGKGTSNYVLFDAKDARIVERNGEFMPRAFQEAARQENARNAVPGEKAEQVAAQPFAEIPQAKGEPAQPTHINYNYINTPDDVKGAMSRISEVYKAEIEAQRRGTVTWEQTSQEAAKILSDTLGVADSSLMLPREPGTAAGAAEILARKQLTIGAAEDMMRARDNLLNKGLEATTQDRFEFLAAIERAAMIQSEFLGARAEAGRALNILKESRVEADRAKLVLEVIERYGKDPMELARMLKEIDNPAGALKFAEKVQKATSWEQVVEAWKAGLVSGPITHVANVLGNTTFLALRGPIDAVAAGFGLLRSGPDKVVATESLARIAGALHAVPEGLKVAGAILRTGEYDISAGKADAHRRAIPGATGEVVRLPFRALAAEDALFRAMNERGELYAMAMREARGQGLNPATREFREKVAELVNNPSPDMQKAIEKAGERFTFNSPLGEKGQAVQQFVRAWHLEWAVPFIRTPGNVMKELARLTPAAPLVKEWRDALAKGGAEADKALAEVVVGSAIASTAMAFAFDGAISGAGDPDPAKKRVAAAAGWQPYSVKIGDTWYSYQRLQPVGTLIGLAADMAEVWDHTNEEESDKLPKMLSVAFANAVTNQTFLQGITNIVNAMSDPTRFGPRFVQGLAASTVPAAVSQTAQLNDPYVREIESVLDAVKNRVPGLRESLLPSRDVFGEPRQNRDRLGIVSPIVTSTESADPVRKEAMRLGVAVAKAPDEINLPAGGDRKLGKVELTPEQQDVFATVSGQMAHRIMSDIINSGTWERMPDMVKRRTFDIVFERARKAGRAEALPLDQREKEAERIANELRDRLGY